MGDVTLKIAEARLAACKSKIRYWEIRRDETEKLVERLREFGDPPRCNADVSYQSGCPHRSKWRVGGEKAVCTNHLASTIKSVGEAVPVEAWPWPQN